MSKEVAKYYNPVFLVDHKYRGGKDPMRNREGTKGYSSETIGVMDTPEER